MKLYFAFIKEVAYGQKNDNNYSTILFSVNISQKVMDEVEFKRQKLESQRITKNEILNDKFLKINTNPIFTHSHQTIHTQLQEDILFSFRGYKLLKYSKEGYAEDVGCSYFLTDKLRNENSFSSIKEIINNILKETASETYNYEGTFNYSKNPIAPEPYDEIYNHVREYDDAISSKHNLETSIPEIKKQNKLKKV